MHSNFYLLYTALPVNDITSFLKHNKKADLIRIAKDMGCSVKTSDTTETLEKAIVEGYTFINK